MTVRAMNLDTAHEDQEQLFDPSTSLGHGPLEVGLVVASGIVSELGGRIGAHREGCDLVFRLVLSTMQRRAESGRGTDHISPLNLSGCGSWWRTTTTWP